MRYITVESILDYVDEVKKNSFSRRIKLIWLNEIEYRIQIEVMLIAAENIASVPDDDDHELMIPAPFHEIYYDYLLMKISENLEESSEQNNRAQTFERAYTAFMRWWADNYTPGNGNAEFKGYYVHGKDGNTPIRGVDYMNAEDKRFIEGFMIKLAPFLDGEYSGDKEYTENNIVEYEHKLYWHIGKEPTTGIDPSDGGVWRCILFSTEAPGLDSTLTQSGLAADAKAVGDRFENIMAEIVTDATLSESGKPADAKTTGDAISGLNEKADGNREAIVYLDEHKASNDVVEAIDDRVAQNSINIATQAQRLNEMATLPEGSTTADAELIDIRTGAHGESYVNAGNSVRYQFDALNKGNCVDIFKTCSTLNASRTHLGVTYTYDKLSSALSFSGTSTGNSICNILGSSSTWPVYLEHGKKYRFNIDKLPDGVKIFLTKYASGEPVSQKKYTSSFEFDADSTITGLIISARVASGNTVSGTAHIECLSALTHDELFDNIISSDKDSRAILGAAKKASSEFSPLTSIYCDSSNDNPKQFKAGKTYRGIPYSNQLFSERTVLFNVSLESAFTMFLNPYADVYSFNPYRDNPPSKQGVDGSAVWSGAVCSTWVSWATGRKLNMVVDEIERYLNWKMRYDATAQKYTAECDVDDLEVGDVLWQSGHVALISGFNVGINGIEKILITEMWTPTFAAKWYTVSEFWERIYSGKRSAGGTELGSRPYSIGRFDDDYKIRTLPKLQLVDDIITNKGDNAYFKLGEDVWTYITDSDHVLTFEKPDGTSVTVDYTTLPQQGSDPVFNLKPVLTAPGLYKIKGTHGTYASRITIYSIIGAVSATVTSMSPHTTHVSVGEHEGCEIVGFSLLTMKTDETVNNASVYPVPPEAETEGYVRANASTWKAFHDAVSDSEFNINTSAKSTESYFVRVYFETGCGLAYKDSNPIYDGGAE